MGTRRFQLRSFILLLAPLAIVSMWTLQPMLLALLSAATYNPHIDLSIGEDQDVIVQSIQKHFAKYNISIPKEDIVSKSFAKRYQERLFLQLDQQCGHGSVYVWVPLKFRIPLVGSKAIEWCWIPQLETAKKLNL